MDCSTPDFRVLHHLPEFAQTHVHWVGDAIQPSRLLSSPLLLLPSIFSSIRVFSNELALHIRWPKYWSFSISPSNEYSGLISFRMDWLDLLAVPGTLKSLLQHHSSKASMLLRSAFFIVPLSHPYMTTGKTMALTRRALLHVSNSCYLIKCNIVKYKQNIPKIMIIFSNMYTHHNSSIVSIIKFSLFTKYFLASWSQMHCMFQFIFLIILMIICVLNILWRQKLDSIFSSHDILHTSIYLSIYIYFFLHIATPCVLFYPYQSGK